MSDCKIYSFRFRFFRGLDWRWKDRQSLVIETCSKRKFHPGEKLPQLGLREALKKADDLDEGIAGGVW